MHRIRLSVSIILSTVLLLAASCNNAANKAKENNVAQTIANDTMKSAASSVPSELNNGQSSEDTDTSTTLQKDNNTDSMLSQSMAAIFGENDSGILKNIDGGKKDSVTSKLQAMMGGKSDDPGDAIGKSLLNFQLSQMSDNNPLKAVIKGKLAAQENGTAGPSKTYTASYVAEQPANYTVPVSGNGNTIILQYTGGSMTNSKKDGLWKNVYVSTDKGTQWNVYSEAYAESSAINMKVHSTSLAGINETYSINLNDQYKKYAKQQRSDLGKNESAVEVQKAGSEKMFGYNCVHVKIYYTIKELGQTAHLQDDEWYSNEVPGSQFLSPFIFENHSAAVVKKIMDDGCAGVLVKSVTTSAEASKIVQLTGIIKKDIHSLMFSFPSNYQEDKNVNLYDIQ
jgi:hypothetical protein